MLRRVRSLLSFALWPLLVGLMVAGWSFFRVWHLPQAARITFSWQSDAAARVQVYYDSGQGLNESESVWVLLPGLPEFQTVRFDLPAMYLGALRFDVTDGDQPVRIRGLTLSVDPFDGEHPLSELPWTHNGDIDRLERKGDEWRIVPRAGATDPQLAHVFTPRLRTYTKTSGMFWATLPRALTWGLGAAVFTSLALGLWRTKGRWQGSVRRRPWVALVGLASLSTCLALYPLWLSGRSLVSPHIGAAMLYGGPPYVSGSTSVEMGQAYGADIGALFWSHLPSAKVVAEAAEAGEWPYWNRYNGAGVPLLGQGQTMAGEPLQGWVNAMGGAPWAWDVKFAVVRFLFAFGLAGATWLLWGRLSGAAVVALAAPWIGFFNFRFNHPGIFSNGYAPLLLLAWIGFAKAQTRAGLLGSLFGILVSSWVLFTSGTVKEAYLSFACFTLMGCAGVWIEATNSEPLRRRKRWAAAVVVVLLIGVSAPLWYSFLTTQAASFNVYQTPRANTIPPGFLLGLFDDLFPRLSTPQHYVFTPAGNGLLWLGLGAALLRARTVTSRGWFLGLAAAAALCVALAFSVVPRSWILVVPFLRNVAHIDGIFSSLALVPLWLLAGYGFSHLFAPSPLSRRWTIGPPLLATGAGLLACGVTLALREPSSWAEFWRTRAAYLPDLTAWCLGLGLIYTALAWRKACEAKVVLVLVGTFLLLFRHGLHSPEARDLWPTLSVPGPRVPLGQQSASVRWVQGQMQTPARILGTDNEMIPGVTALYDLEGINSPDALMVRSYRELLVAAGLTEGEDWRVMWTAERLATHRRLLDLLGVRYVFTRLETLPDAAAAVLRQKLDLNVFERASPWPRAFFVGSYLTYEDVTDFVAQLERHPGGPAAWIEEKDLAQLSAYARPTDPGPAVAAHGYHLTPNRTRFHIEAPGPGLAVLQETYHPGVFQASLNGQPVPLVRVNHAFRAIEIPAHGSYVIEVFAAPEGMTIAGWSALVSLAAFIGFSLHFARSAPRLHP